MRLGIGLWGLVFTLTLVVGSIAQQPNGTAPPQSEGAAAKTPQPPPFRVKENIPGEKMVAPPSESRPQVGAAGQLIGFNGFDGSGSQTITLVHAGKMQIAVYHIDRSGLIRLVSSRPIDADFSVTLNPTAPLPDQIRALAGQAK